MVAHEVKSVGSIRYVEEPSPKHLEQLQFYLNVLGLENGRLDYVEKSILSMGTGEKVNVSFPVKGDAKTFTGLLERAVSFTDISYGERLRRVRRAGSADTASTKMLAHEGRLQI